MNNHFNKKKENVEIFKRLCEIISEDEYIQKDIEDSIKSSRIYSKTINDFDPNTMEKFDCITLDDMPDVCDDTSVIFMPTNTIDAAIYVLRNMLPDKVCILNFASAKKPGGMVINGSSAQEECICRSTTLYQILSNKVFYDPYYRFHRCKTDNFYSSTLIYSPRVNLILDGSYNQIQYHDEYEPFYVDVITSPFPNLRKDGWWHGDLLNYSSDDDKSYKMELFNSLYNIYVDRIDNIFRAAIDNHVDYFIVGAWGCGVFRNNPSYVAKAYKEVIQKYDKKISNVVFAIPDAFNYNTFEGIIKND